MMTRLFPVIPAGVAGLLGTALLMACGPAQDGAHCDNVGEIRCLEGASPPQASVCRPDNTWRGYLACPGPDWVCNPCTGAACDVNGGCRFQGCAPQCAGAMANKASLCLDGGGHIEVTCGEGMGTCTPNGNKGCSGPCGLPMVPACKDATTLLICGDNGKVTTQGCEGGCVDGVGCSQGRRTPDASGSDGGSNDTGPTDAGQADVPNIACPQPVEGSVCADDSSCTVDTCDTTKGTCVHTPSDALCDDSNACTQDHCALSGANSACTHAPVSATCSDNNPCTLQDGCSQGKCSGIQKNCDDGNVCTNDACGTDCEHTPLTGNCDADGSACTPDTCDGGVCKPGTAIACNDMNPCTADACDPKANCTYTPVAGGTACDDGFPCTQPDTCQAGNCSGTPVACADGLDCVAGTCQVADHDWTSWKPPLTPKGLKPDAAGETVYHGLTGRTWQRQTSASMVKWAAAQKVCDDLVLAGKGDWRLPTAVELVSLLDLSKPAKEALIDLGAFPGTPAAAFWSGTQWATTGMYIGMNFQLGAGGPVDPNTTMYVRCVR